MKHYFILSIFLICWAITGCSNQAVLIIIDSSAGPEGIRYSVPISGTGYKGFAETVKKDKNEKFELYLKLNRSSFIYISDDDFQTNVKLLIQPGNNYCVSIYPDKTFHITGANEKGQMLYASLPDPDFIQADIVRIVDPDNDSIPLNEFHTKALRLKQEEVSKFKALLNANEITKSFYNLVEKDRDCYYASLEAKFILLKVYVPVMLDMRIEKTLLEGLSNIYTQYPPNDNSLVFSSFWYEYAGFYINDYQQFIQKDFELQKFYNLRNEGVFHEYIIDESKKYLSGRALEFFSARYIHSGYLKSDERDEREFLSLLDQFKKNYPDSDYIKFF